MDLDFRICFTFNNAEFMRSIKDYLHLYLYCDMRYSTHHEPQNETYTLTTLNLAEAIEFEDKPILRPLSDMTEEEEKVMIATQDDVRLDGFPQILLKTDSGETIRYMLSKGFDLFNLIEEGLAIDKTTLK